MRTFADRIEQLGASLTLIGTGTPAQGREFATRNDSPFRVLVDPELVGYRAAELQQRLFGGFGLRTLPRLIRALRDGFRGFGTQGSPHQLGGVFVVTPGNELLYSHLSRTLDDRANPREIVAALEKHRGQSAA